MRVVPVRPVGRTTRSLGLVRPSDGGPCRIEPVATREYPPSPLGAQLRRYRTAVDRGGDHVSLGDAARAIGVSAVDVSDLERGRATLDPVDWRRAFDAVRALSRVPVEFGDVASILESERDIGRAAGIGWLCEWHGHAGATGPADVLRFSAACGWLPCCAACAGLPNA